MIMSFPHFLLRFGLGESSDPRPLCHQFTTKYGMTDSWIVWSSQDKTAKMTYNNADKTAGRTFLRFVCYSGLTKARGRQ
ncbi:hypothetical protein BAU14_12940 [Enterococcus sp. CU9D]|nr:hypothetical protein BAU14_12940 [Enterococcus sp. CU9D]